MTTPTQLLIPSSNLLDSRFNFEKLDQIVNSDSNYYTDRFGKQRLTVKGLENLANQISIDLENNLTTPDGYRMIGKVASFNDLRSIPPLIDGQKIILNEWEIGYNAGGGEFVGRMGDNIDDGGHIAAGDGFYWERVTDAVNLDHYGIKISSRVTSTFYDCTDALQQATNRAIATGLPLVSTYTYQNDPGTDAYPRFGIYISKTWEITGLKQLIGQFNIFVKASELSVSGTIPIGATVPYAIIDANCKWGENGKIFSTSAGNQMIDKIVLFNMDGYKADVFLNGMLIIANGSRFNYLSATSFNGRGVNFADAYDNYIQDVRVQWSGNQNNYALTVGSWKADSTSKGDESNANTFANIMTHNSIEKSWMIVGSKQTVVRIHDEAILAKTSAPTSPYGFESRNGYGYASCYFSSQAGSLLEVSFSTFDSASTVEPVLCIGGGVGISVGTIYLNQDKGIVSVINGDPGYVGASYIQSITSRELRTVANANTTIGNVKVETLILNDPKSAITGGVVSKDLTVNSSSIGISIGDLTVSGVATFNTASLVRNVLFNSDVVINYDWYSTVSLRMTHVFAHCRFLGNFSSEASRVVISDSSIGAANKTFNVLGAGETVTVKGGRLYSPITLSNKGGLFLDEVSYSGGTITSSSTGDVAIRNGLGMSATSFTSSVSGKLSIDGTLFGQVTGTGSIYLNNSTITGAYTVGDNGIAYFTNSVVGDFLISGTGVKVDAIKSFFNKFNFDTGKTNTGIWRISPDCVTWTSANWVTPTVSSGYGLRTYDMSTGSLYKTVSNVWKKVTETTA